MEGGERKEKRKKGWREEVEGGTTVCNVQLHTMKQEENRYKLIMNRRVSWAQPRKETTEDNGMERDRDIQTAREERETGRGGTRGNARERDGKNELKDSWKHRHGQRIGTRQATNNTSPHDRKYAQCSNEN